MQKHVLNQKIRILVCKSMQATALMYNKQQPFAMMRRPRCSPMPKRVIRTHANRMELGGHGFNIEDAAQHTSSLEIQSCPLLRRIDIDVLAETTGDMLGRSPDL